MAACAILLASTFPPPAIAATSDELEEEAAALMESLDSIQTEINETQERYDEAVAAREEAMEAMEEAEARIAEAQAVIEENQEKLSERAVALYKSNTIGIIDVILGTSSFTEFATLYETINIISQRDIDLVEESKAARAEADAAREEYQELAQAAEEQMQEAQEAQVELETKASEMQSEIAKISEELSELEAQESVDGDEASLLYSRNSTGVVIVGNGLFTHPCPGYTYLSSTFGYRTYDNSFHKGLDFAASTGTPIYAAASGTVTISGYSSSAGYWVVINHGNGLVTKYMHMVSMPYVSAGQTVSKGQNIGAVGSTGNSSGPHLHFQVELNGTAVNPEYYL